MSLRATLQPLVDALTAGGVPATLDPQNLNPPGAWIQLESLQHNILRGRSTIRARIYLVTGDAPAATVLDQLDQLLTATLAVATPNTPLDTESVTVTLPNDSTPLPALQLTIDLLERT